MQCTKWVKIVAGLGVAATLAACGGGDAPAGAAVVVGKLTISESYNTISGDLDFTAAKGSNVAETPTAGDLAGIPICALRYEGIKVGTSTDSFNVNLYFKQSDKSVVFAGIFDLTNFIAFNMNGTDDVAKITVDTAAKTATFNNVLLKSNENAANTARINGTAALVGSTTGACGT